MDLRIEYANTDLPRARHLDLAGIWYNNATYVSGDRLRGYPLGHWMGTDAVDYFVRSTRYMTDVLQLGMNWDYWERGRGQPVHEKRYGLGPDLTWWLSPFIQWQLTYTFQRIQNPGQITNLNPFAETFASGITSTNHLLWTNLAVQF